MSSSSSISCSTSTELVVFIPFLVIELQKLFSKGLDGALHHSLGEVSGVSSLQKRKTFDVPVVSVIPSSSSNSVDFVKNFREVSLDIGGNPDTSGII